MTKKTPTANGRGIETLAGQLHVLNTPTACQVQCLIARHAITLETAAIIAVLAFGRGGGPC